jgi:putative peptidoglycan lipid II flippase
VAGLTLVSRISGFLRDFTTAALLGAGATADAFFVAFKIPNLFRAMFAEGAFNSAFVPLFSKTLDTKGKHGARAFAKSIFAFLFYALLGITVAAEIFMPFVVDMFAPGFASDPAKRALTVELSRITFPFLMLVALASFFGAILNSLGLFKPYAVAPIVLNLCIIGAALALPGIVPDAAHALAIGVSVAGVIQLAVLARAAYKKGFGVMSFKPARNAQTDGFFKRFGPGMVSAGIYHLNVFIGGILATASSGATSYIYYADRLNQLPVGVIGVAAATVLLPSLSRDVQAARHESAKDRFNDSLVFTSTLVMPAAVGLFLLAEPLVAVVFEHGAFVHADTVATAVVLQILALSLPALTYLKLFANLFYARGDTSTPMKLSLIALATNTASTVAFNWMFGYRGIVAAISLNNWVMLAMLWMAAHRRGFTGIAPAAGKLCFMAAASAVMGIVLLFIRPLAEGFFGLVSACLAGALAYGIMLLAAKMMTRRSNSPAK